MPDSLVAPPELSPPAAALVNPTLLWSVLTLALERLAYYGLRSLLLPYLINDLHQPATEVSRFYEGQMALLWLTPLLGGWLADGFWGVGRTRRTGSLVLLAGYSLMLLGVWGPWSAEGRWLLFGSGATAMQLGNGLLVPALYVGVGQAYPLGQSRNVLAALLLLYVGLSVGALLGPLVCGTFADLWSAAGGFLVAAVVAGGVGLVAWQLPDLSSQLPAGRSRVGLGLAILLVAGALGAWWLGQAYHQYWLLPLAIVSSVVVLVVVSFQPHQPSARSPLVLGMLLVGGVVASALMNGWTISLLELNALPGLTTTLLAPLAGAALLLAGVWRSHAPNGGEKMLVLALLVLGAALVIWSAAMLMPASGGWARWGAVAIVLLYIGKQAYDLGLAALITNAGITRYAGLAMGLYFALGRLGSTVVEAVMKLIERWQ